MFKISTKVIFIVKALLGEVHPDLEDKIQLFKEYQLSEYGRYFLLFYTANNKETITFGIIVSLRLSIVSILVLSSKSNLLNNSALIAE